MSELRKEMEPGDSNRSAMGRMALNILSGVIPFAGGALAAFASNWSEEEQNQVNMFLQDWIKMLEDEIKEKGQTIVEITSRLNLLNEEVQKRITSDNYQSLLKKAFREWSAAESERKRVIMRNILTNAATAEIVSDDVVKMFLDWLRTYSELHFEVIAIVYKNPGITRGGMWEELGKPDVREDSAEADLFRLLVDDLSQGRVMRQHRDKDINGQWLKKRPQRTKKGSTAPKTMKSAFSDEEEYSLTALGEQFVHYAMNELTVRIAAPSDTVASKTPEQGE